MSPENAINIIYNIQTAIKPYKLKKLFFSQHFRSLYYNVDDKVNTLRREYQLCTHLWLRWFRAEEIVMSAPRSRGFKPPFASSPWVVTAAGISDTSGGTLPPVRHSRPWSEFAVGDEHRAMSTAWIAS
jgi:hypothetical protein